MATTQTTKWYVISEALADGAAREVHRVRAEVEDDATVSDPAKARAEEWARTYSDQTGTPTTIDAVWLGASGEPERVESDEFYYNPEYPQRDPHEEYGY